MCLWLTLPSPSSLFLLVCFPFICFVSGLFHLCLPACPSACPPACLSFYLFCFPEYWFSVYLFCLGTIPPVSPSFPRCLPICMSVFPPVCFTIWLFYLPPCLSSLCLCLLSPACASPSLSYFSLFVISVGPSCVSQRLLPIPRLPACLHDCLPACPFPSICVSKDCVLYLSHLPPPPTPLPIPLHPPPPTLFPTSGSQASSQPRPDWELQVPAARAAVADVGAVGGRGLTAAG